MATTRQLLAYMRTVSRGSPVDAPWSVAGQMATALRLGSRHAPKDSPLTIADVLARPDYRDLMTPTVREGEDAPDFGLPLVDGGFVQLSELVERSPVALVFGSYTWPPFRAQAGTLEQLAARYRDRVSFLLVYIKEAHPEDGWVIAENRRSEISLLDPRSNEERAGTAAACATALRLSIPTAVDAVDNAVASTYGGWPDRLYLVGADGRIAYQGGEGPFGFVPEELEAAIERELA